MPAGDKIQAEDRSAKRRQVRVFISSPCREMHAARNHLITVIFPELRHRAEQLELDLVDLDLRPGVAVKDANGETANPGNTADDGSTIRSRSSCLSRNLSSRRHLSYKILKRMPCHTMYSSAIQFETNS
jgi:hypothetical protein